jgi:hypothetical protein
MGVETTGAAVPVVPLPVLLNPGRFGVKRAMSASKGGIRRLWVSLT